ncbi:MAG: hypothetical protein ABF449_02815 [Ethanoligenens sp.]
MDKEELQRRIEAGAFAANNGKVLRAINIMAGNDIRLRSLQYALAELSHGELSESLYYLQDSGYIKIRKANSHMEIEVSDADYDDTDVRITAKGMQLLMGYTTDPVIKV